MTVLHEPSAKAWSALLKAPRAPAKPPMQRNQASPAMWDALDAGDDDALAHALQSGASVKNRRQNRYPIEQAVEDGNWSGVKLLLAHGASFKQGVSWDCLVPRDCPEDAEQLRALGLPLPTKTTIQDWVAWKKPPLRLLTWYLDQVDVSQARKVVPSLEALKRGAYQHPWLRAALRGPSRLRLRMMALWGIAEKSPYALVHAFQGASKTPVMLTVEWVAQVLTLVSANEVAAVQQLFQDGWGVPGLTEVHRARRDGARHAAFIDPGWMFVHAKGVELVNWWRSVPELAQQMDQAARDCPALWWRVFKESSPAAEAWLRAEGYLDQALVPDAAGNTLLHHLAQGSSMAKRHFTWMTTKGASGLMQANRAGKTPLALMQRQSEYASWLREWQRAQAKRGARQSAQQLRQVISTARGRSRTPTPRRTRL